MLHEERSSSGESMAETCGPRHFVRMRRRQQVLRAQAELRLSLDTMKHADQEGPGVTGVEEKDESGGARRAGNLMNTDCLFEEVLGAEVRRVVEHQGPVPGLAVTREREHET